MIKNYSSILSSTTPIKSFTYTESYILATE